MSDADREALSYGGTLLAEMSKLTRNHQRDDSISVHWHEKDGERASAAYGALVHLLSEVKRLETIEAAAVNYANQRKRFPRSGAEIHAYGKLETVLATPPTTETPT